MSARIKPYHHPHHSRQSGKTIRQDNPGDAPDAIDLKEVRGDVAFEHVRFSYYGSVAPILRDRSADLRTIRQASLRHHLGVVLQDALLFNDTIRDNIADGRPEATQSEIECVARTGHAHEFMMRLPESYETKVGEPGSRLSVSDGGETEAYGHISVDSTWQYRLRKAHHSRLAAGSAFE